MHKKLASFVKYNKVLLSLYRLAGNLLAAVLRIFVKTEPKLILFMSYGGQKYDDSPRAIYEKMKQDSYFDEYRFVWAFTNPENYPDLDCEKVKTETLKFYCTAVSAKYWIHNSSMERGLKLKKKGTFELNTNHGTPLKVFGIDVPSAAYTAKTMYRDNVYHCAQSNYERDIYSHCLQCSPDQFIVKGLPRNDSLFTYNAEKITAIRNSIGIPADKKIILYAPTFREYDRDGQNACYINPPITIEKWKKYLGDQYVVLFRAHYEIINVLGIQDDGFIFNVSNYPYLNDLLVISDMMISDYSSIYFDFSILDKPMFNFAYDYEAYMEHRGLYLDLYKDFPFVVHKNEDELLADLTTFDEEKAVAGTKAFHSKYATYSGSASAAVVEFIKDGIQHNKW